MKKQNSVTLYAIVLAVGISLLKTTPVLCASVLPFNAQDYFVTIPPDSLYTNTKGSDVTRLSIPIREEIFLLGCENMGFAGYFGIENWEIKNLGDGGVDVTGAPNGLLIHTIGESPDKENPRGEWQCKIVIPSEGYVYLDLEKIGGSIFSMEYAVNGKTPLPLYRSDKKINSHFTTLLHRNDVLEIRLSFDAGKSNTFLLKDFHFFTNTEKIKQKTALSCSFWDGIPVFSCNRSFISTPVMGIGNIILPENVITSKGRTTPKYTGYPLVDLDGLAYTEEDQFYLNNRVTPFVFKWEDVRSIVDGEDVILRKWTVKDQCKENVLVATQKIVVADSNITMK